MDALNDDGGQAAIVVVFVIAVAAVVMGGLRLTQSALLARAVERRAGEAAVEAATAVVADAYAMELRRRAQPSPSPRDMRSVVTDPRTREDARVAASDMSLRNGGESVTDVGIGCDDGTVRITLVLRGTGYHASFGAGECSQP